MSDSGQLLDDVQNGAQWHQWRMNQLNPANDKPVDTSPSADAVKKPAAKPNLELIEKQSRDKGYKEGYAAGHKEGHKAGFAEAKEKGYEKGLEEGRQAAKEEFSRQAKHNLKFLLPLAENFAKAIDDMEQRLSADLVDLAYSIGEQLALETLQTKPHVILKVVRELMNVEINPAGRPQLVLHPADLWLVEEHLGSELSHLGWQTKGDDSVTRGGCLVRGSNCEMNATWESRWEALNSRKRQRRTEQPSMAPEVDG